MILLEGSWSFGIRLMKGVRNKNLQKNKNT